MFHRWFEIPVIAALFAACALGQQSSRQNPPADPVPVYRFIVENGIDAVTYPYRAAPTKIDFRGTLLAPEAKGEATVQSQQGGTRIDAKFEKLPDPSHIGPNCLVFVLWAITPEGGSRNLGEILPDASHRARLRTITDLQTLALIVTAEPYSNVRLPGSAVTMENHVRPDTNGKVVPVHAKPELLPPTQYTRNLPEQPQAPRSSNFSTGRSEDLTELNQARNAIAIAQAANAEHYAPEAWAAAQSALSKAESLEASKANANLVIENARDAAQRAEDARTIAERAGALAAGNAQRGIPAGASGQKAEPAAARAPAEAPAEEASREAPDSALRARLHKQLDGSLLAHDAGQSLVITLPETSFDGTGLLRSVAQKLAPVASALVSQPGVRVEINGYMDSAELASWERAEAVRKALVESGVAPNQVSMRGGQVSSDRGQERRVQIVISGDQIVTSGGAPPGSARPPEPQAAPAQTLRSGEAARESAADQAVIRLPDRVPESKPAPPTIRMPEEAVRFQAEGRKLLSQERYPEAIQELTEALKLDGSLALAYNARGFAYLRLREYSDAVADFDAAIRLNPSYANAYWNRSACRHALGDRSGENADLARARQLGGAQ